MNWIFLKKLILNNPLNWILEQYWIEYWMNHFLAKFKHRIESDRVSKTPRVFAFVNWWFTTCNFSPDFPQFILSGCPSLTQWNPSHPLNFPIFPSSNNRFPSLKVFLVCFSFPKRFLFLQSSSFHLHGPNIKSFENRKQIIA